MTDLIERLRLQAKLGMFDTPPEHKHVGYGEAADALERQAALLMEARAALREYMSQFGQGLEAHGIPYGKAQIAADCRARSVLKALEVEDADV